MGFFDDIKDSFFGVGKTIGDLGSGDIEFIKDPIGKVQKDKEWSRRGFKDPEEEDEEEQDAGDVQRQQEVASGISEPGYADPGVSPEDREAFDAEAWREQMIQQTNDFITLNTRAMDTRDRILLRPIQNRDTLRYGGTSSVQDALPLQLVHSANVV